MNDLVDARYCVKTLEVEVVIVWKDFQICSRGRMVPV